MDQNEKERILAQTVSEVVELVEHMLERKFPHEYLPDHIRGMSLEVF